MLEQLLRNVKVSAMPSSAKYLQLLVKGKTLPAIIRIFNVFNIIHPSLSQASFCSKRYILLLEACHGGRQVEF